MPRRPDLRCDPAAPRVADRLRALPNADRPTDGDVAVLAVEMGNAARGHHGGCPGRPRHAEPTGTQQTFVIGFARERRG